MCVSISHEIKNFSMVISDAWCEQSSWCRLLFLILLKSHMHGSQCISFIFFAVYHTAQVLFRSCRKPASERWILYHCLQRRRRRSCLSWYLPCKWRKTGTPDPESYPDRPRRLGWRSSALCRTEVVCEIYRRISVWSGWKLSLEVDIQPRFRLHRRSSCMNDKLNSKDHRSSDCNPLALRRRKPLRQRRWIFQGS
jgi:hypothetical protein